MHEIQDCECCGVTTRGRLCRSCSDRATDASKAFRESVLHALAYKRREETEE